MAAQYLDRLSFRTIVRLCCRYLLGSHPNTYTFVHFDALIRLQWRRIRLFKREGKEGKVRSSMYTLEGKRENMRGLTMQPREQSLLVLQLLGHFPKESSWC